MRRFMRGLRARAGSRRGRLLSAAALGLVVVVGAGAAVHAATASDPVAAAADEFSGWRGVKYRGMFTDGSGVTTAMTLTVAADGRAFGTFQRPSGAQAQLVVNGTESIVKANRQWWQSLARPEPDARADRWVAAQPADSVGLAPVERLTPAGLRRDLATSRAADEWQRTGERVVDDRPGEIWSDGDREVVIGADDPRPVLRLRFPTTEWWPAPELPVGATPADPSDEPRSEEGEVPEPVVELSVEQSDDGETEALEELAGKLKDLLEKAQETVEQAREEDEEARQRQQAENC
jgi:hypothetical protein